MDAGWAKAASGDFPDAERVKPMRERFQWPSVDGDDGEEDHSGESPDALRVSSPSLPSRATSSTLAKSTPPGQAAIGLSSRRLLAAHPLCPQ